MTSETSPEPGVHLGKQGDPGPPEDIDAIQVIRGLRSAVDRLHGTAEKMVSRDYVDAWQMQEERKRRGLATMVVCIGACFFILFGLLGYGMLLVTDLVEEVRQNTETTVECTDPSLENNDCYDQRVKQADKRADEQTRVIVDKLFKRILTEFRAGTFDPEQQP